MRIAVIGAGIAGHSAALALSQQALGHDVTVYEQEQRAGGHAATVDIDYLGRMIAVDTGFIVYNTLNYPNLTAFFTWAGVATEASDMSFSVSADQGRFEWCGRDGKDVFSGLFAQKSNLLSPGYLLMLRQILQFQEIARRERANGGIGPGSLAQYLERHRFSRRLRDDYLVPMGAAIWSMSPKAMLDFPAQSFVDFFDNHCLLQWQRPKWRTVTGGSRSYVRKLADILGARVRLGCGAAQIVRTGGNVEITDAHGGQEYFDQVVIATHAPQALGLLGDATALEKAILGAQNTSTNDVVLHRDPALMPKRRAAWASWNFLREGNGDARSVSVTYWMNRLQNIDENCPLFITLNPPREPAPGTVFGRYAYAHPQYDAPALAARARLAEIQGGNRTWFCGAWTSHGFHEDGMASGLAVAASLGAPAPWAAPTSSARLLDAAA